MPVSIINAAIFLKPGPEAFVRGFFVEIPAKTCKFTHLCGCKPAKIGYFCGHKTKLMKAVFQNTMISLLCLATVVLAAPHQSISLFKSLQNTHNPAKCLSNQSQNQAVTKAPALATMPSIEEKTVRFACW
jgi:hypothetical protein